MRTRTDLREEAMIPSWQQASQSYVRRFPEKFLDQVSK